MQERQFVVCCCGTVAASFYSCLGHCQNRHFIQYRHHYLLRFSTLFSLHFRWPSYIQSTFFRPSVTCPRLPKNIRNIKKKCCHLEEFWHLTMYVIMRSFFFFFLQFSISRTKPSVFDFSVTIVVFSIYSFECAPKKNNLFLLSVV